MKNLIMALLLQLAVNILRTIVSTVVGYVEQIGNTQGWSNAKKAQQAAAKIRAYIDAHPVLKLFRDTLFSLSADMTEAEVLKLPPTRPAPEPLPAVADLQSAPVVQITAEELLKAIGQAAAPAKPRARPRHLVRTPAPEA